MPRNPVYTSFHPAAIEDHHAPLFHSNNHDIDPEFLGNRHLHGVDIAGAPPAKATSPATAGGLLTNTAPATVSQIHARCRRRQIYRCCGLLPRAPPPSDPCAFARAAITAAGSARGLLSHLYGGLEVGGEMREEEKSGGWDGFQTNFRMDQAFVPASSPFPPVSSSSHSFSSAKISNGPTYTKKAKKSNVKDPPIVFRRSDMESEKNDDNPDQTPVSEPPSMNQNGENLIIRFNCREYRVILRKELTNSDVGNIGRIVMPKRDAEAHLPALHQREGVTLKMDDFKFETTWNFKYRFWPNNKSRMYVLESTGGFVKHHGLQTGDIFIIYKSSESGKFVVRGEKAIKPNAIMPVVDCSCKNELNKSEECGFTISLQTKKT
uniref:TF-B3 domain-containing protein n=1 Tax=Oryza glumipatula TaxID=40148 RepID=A0A0D9ZSF5_9ORYZ